MSNKTKITVRFSSQSTELFKIYTRTVILTDVEKQNTCTQLRRIPLMAGASVHGVQVDINWSVHGGGIILIVEH